MSAKIHPFPAKRRQVRLDFSMEALQVLDSIKSSMGFQSRAETIRNALRVLRWVLEHQQNGRRILAVKDGENSGFELCFPEEES